MAYRYIKFYFTCVRTYIGEGYINQGPDATGIISSWLFRNSDRHGYHNSDEVTNGGGQDDMTVHGLEEECF